MAKQELPTSPTKAGWRPDEWTRDTGLSKAALYRLLRSGEVAFVKAGTATIVTTSPREFIQKLAGDAA